MSYTKLGFTSGQVLKAEHLNHIEEGIEAACASSGSSENKVIILVAHNNQNDGSGYTYNDEYVDSNFILDCLLSGYQFIIQDSNGWYGMREWVKREWPDPVVQIYTSNTSASPEFYLNTEN